MPFLCVCHRRAAAHTTPHPCAFARTRIFLARRSLNTCGPRPPPPPSLSPCDSERLCSFFFSGAKHCLQQALNTRPLFFFVLATLRARAGRCKSRACDGARASKCPTTTRPPCSAPLRSLLAAAAIAARHTHGLAAGGCKVQVRPAAGKPARRQRRANGGQVQAAPKGG